MTGKDGRPPRRRGREQESAGVFARIAGALMRAVLVMAMVATPSLILPAVGSDAQQAVSLIALFLGIFVLVEYAATYPGIVEFRHAPPFNRLRFAALFATVIALSLLMRGIEAPGPATAAVTAVGGALGTAIDFPYSPVRLILVMLPPDTAPGETAVLRAAAGLAYLTSVVTLGLFVLLTRAHRWPGPGKTFNVWVNLPTFDPTAGGDVVQRLERDARFNIALGVLLPFLAPMAFSAISARFLALSPENPQMLIWMMTAWAFLPASLFMRGIALGRVAEMIRESRARAEAGAAGAAGRLAAA